MTSAFDDTVLDFDLNLLHPTNNVLSDCRIEKQRKAILIAKRKTIATDSLIKKYYASKEKLEQTEVILLTAKEECKQVCIDYREALERCSQLEKDLVTLTSKNAELDTRFSISQNQYEGMKSYASQLQLLIKKHELAIEALKVEKNLEKSNSDDFHQKAEQSDKNFSSLQKENELLLSHLLLVKDIALGRKKLRKRHKVLLQKYDSSEKTNCSDHLSSESSSEEQDFFDDSPHSPFSISEETPKNTTEQEVGKPIKIEANIKKDLLRITEDQDSDYSNEVVSEDTGRGSSLAFSDGEKCFNSPDYFNNGSPNMIGSDKIKEKAGSINLSSSPKRIHDVVHVATSPLIFDDVALLSEDTTLFHNDASTNTEYFISEIPLSDEIVTIKEKIRVIDVATSPVKDMEKVNIATSPVIFMEVDTQSKNNIAMSSEVGTQTNNVENESINETTPHEKMPVILIEETPLDVNGKHAKIANLESHCELEISGKSLKEKKCLERNNSKNLCNDNSNDCEIEMILNSMRFTQRLITPIPHTPVKFHKNENKKVQEDLHKDADLHSRHTVCPDALVLRQENKALQTSVFDLKKEIMDIKCMLKSHLLNISGTLKTHTSDNIETHTSDVNTELVNDARTRTQETIFVHSNDNSSRIQEEQNDLTNFDDANAFTNQDASHVTSSIERQEDGFSQVNTNTSIQQNATVISMSNEVCDNSKAPKSQLLINERIEESIDKCSNQKVSDDVNNVSIVENHGIFTYEDDFRIDSENDPVINDVSNETEVESSFESKKDKTKCKKLSKLDRFKKKLLPKSKISANISSRKSRPKPMTVIPRNTQMKATAILNNRSVYENAAKVMAELKSKRNKSVSEENKLRNEKTDNTNEDIVNSNTKEVIKNQLKSKNNKLRNGIETISDKNEKTDNTNEDIVNSNTKEVIKNQLKSKNNKLRNGIETISDKNEKTDNTNEDIVNSNTKEVIKNQLQSKNNDTTVEEIRSKRDIIEVITDKRSSDEGKNDHHITKNKEELLHSKNQMPKCNPKNNPVLNPVVCLSKLDLKKYDRKRSGNRNSISKQDSNIVAPKVPERLTTPITPPSENGITTRSRSRKLSRDSTSSLEIELKDDDKSNKTEEKRKKLKRLSTDIPDTPCKRVLRSSGTLDVLNDEDDVKLSVLQENMKKVPLTPNKLSSRTLSKDTNVEILNTSIKNNECNNTNAQNENSTDKISHEISHPKESFFCKMIEKHGRKDKSCSQRVPENVAKDICKKLETSIAAIIELPHSKAQTSMDKLVDEIHTWNKKNFIAGLMKYLKDPDRKRELYNKVQCSAAPAMSRCEQVLLYITRRVSLLPELLEHLEFALFQLNRTPDFDIIESLSHFYALVCRYFGLKTRLRLFLLDAMYCLQFKVVPLVKQCLDVWMHILPLAHMGIAKSPLVTCLVYLLHFYKCEDRFNRVSEIRYILNRKYFYELSDWNETRILDMFRTAIREVRDIPIEKKMLRTAIIILGKRHGPKWCQKNIIKNMLMPIIEQNDISCTVRKFCVSLLGALIKPFPADMKVHFEITLNYLIDLLDQNPPDDMKEAIFTSLIYMSTHNTNRVTIALLAWKPNRVSPEFEQLLKDFIRVKPISAWKKILSRLKL